MLTLLTFPKGFGQFSFSPFCVKAAYLLAVSGREWTRKDVNDPRKMPQAKLPVLDTPEGLIADSSAIADWLGKNGAQFQAGLSDVQKAQSVAIIRLAEDHLYFHLLMDRWGNDDVWPTLRDAYFDVIPRPIRGPVTARLRRQILRGLTLQGIARFPAKDRMARCERDLLAIATQLSQNRFLMGDAPTLADFSVVPMLAAMRATPVRTELSQRIAQDRPLTDYIESLQHAVPLP